LQKNIKKFVKPKALVHQFYQSIHDMMSRDLQNMNHTVVLLTHIDVCCLANHLVTRKQREVAKNPQKEQYPKFALHIFCSRPENKEHAKIND
jgi:hypothetical protein